MAWPNPSFETADGTDPINAAGWSVGSAAQAENWAVFYLDGRAQRYESFTWSAYDDDPAPIGQAVITSHVIGGKPVESFEELWTGSEGYVFELPPEALTIAPRLPGIITRSIVQGLPRYGVTSGSTPVNGNTVAAAMPPPEGLDFTYLAATAYIEHPSLHDVEMGAHDATALTSDQLLASGSGSGAGRLFVSKAFTPGGVIQASITPTSLLAVSMSDSSGINEGGHTGTLFSGAFYFYEAEQQIETFAGWNRDNAVSMYLTEFDETCDLQFFSVVPYFMREDFEEGWGDNLQNLVEIATAQTVLDGVGTMGDLLETFTAQPEMLFTVYNLSTDTLQGNTPAVGNPATLTARVTLTALETPLPAPLAAGVPYIVTNVSGSFFKLTTDGSTVVDITTLGAGVIVADKRFYWTETLEGFY